MQFWSFSFKGQRELRHQYWFFFASMRHTKTQFSFIGRITLRQSSVKRDTTSVLLEVCFVNVILLVLIHS